jgi:hypothetical protein
VIDPVHGQAVRSWLAGGEPLEFGVLSSSMEPTLFAGDVVQVRSPDRLWPGDILLIDLHGRYVVHRLILLWPSLRTAGDASSVLDPPLTRDRVVARVTAVGRKDSWTPLPTFPRTLPALVYFRLRAGVPFRIRRIIARLRGRVR